MNNFTWASKVKHPCSYREFKAHQCFIMWLWQAMTQTEISCLQFSLNISPARPVGSLQLYTSFIILPLLLEGSYHLLSQNADQWALKNLLGSPKHHSPHMCVFLALTAPLSNSCASTHGDNCGTFCILEIAQCYDMILCLLYVHYTLFEIGVILLSLGPAKSCDRGWENQCPQSGVLTSWNSF